MFQEEKARQIFRKMIISYPVMGTRTSGPILESKGMRAIFQKKSKKIAKYLKFGQKCTKFENTMKTAGDCVRLSHAINC